VVDFEQKILIIRRDNIGDLICTVPLILAVRSQLPEARIECLVNSYNKAVLDGIDEIDKVHFYTKSKHQRPLLIIISLFKRVLKIIELRLKSFDLILLPGQRSSSADRFSRFIGARRIVHVPEAVLMSWPHEVEKCCQLLPLVGLKYETPRLKIVPKRDYIENLVREYRLRPDDKITAVHISARKLSQRWPIHCFVVLINTLLAQEDRNKVILLWSPGEANNPLHPGDDAKSAELQRLVNHERLLPIETADLSELVAALSIAQKVVCSDGGAMHVAAALGKKIVALFGDSEVARWRPWCTNAVIIQKQSFDVSDISIAEVVTAWDGL